LGGGFVGAKTFCLKFRLLPIRRGFGAAAETATGHTRPDCAGKSAGDIDENTSSPQLTHNHRASCGEVCMHTADVAQAPLREAPQPLRARVHFSLIT